MVGRLTTRNLGSGYGNLNHETQQNQSYFHWELADTYPKQAGNVVSLWPWHISSNLRQPTTVGQVDRLNMTATKNRVYTRVQSLRAVITPYKTHPNKPRVWHLAQNEFTVLTTITPGAPKQNVALYMWAAWLYSWQPKKKQSVSPLHRNMACDEMLKVLVCLR